MSTAGSGVKFFFDNDLSPNLAKGMQAFGENVTHLLDHLPPDTPDEEWLEFVGKSDYIVISHDRRIRSRPAQTEALRRHGVGAFIFVGKPMTRCQQIQQIVKLWPTIKEHAQKEPRPFIIQMRRTGEKVKRIL